jgi:hypothetical protein
VQLLQRALDAAAAKVVQVDSLNDFVFAALAAAWVTEQNALGYAVASVGRNAHADPVALRRAVDPVANVIYRSVGGARS